MKQSTFYYLLRRGLLKSMSVVREGLVMFNKFTTAGISHPAQGSAEFDGSSDYLAFPTFFSVDEISVSYWVNRGSVTGATNNHMFFQGTGYAGNGFYTEFESAGKFQVVVSSTLIKSTTASIGTNQWDYVSLTYDGTDLKVYVNGSLENTQAVTITTPTTYSQFGRYAGISNYYKGNAANLAIWNRALSSDEINAVMWKGYQSLTDNEKSGLKAWYSLDDVASPAASLATMEALAVDKDATIENKAAVTAAINALS